MAPPRNHFYHLNVNGLRPRMTEVLPALQTCAVAAFQDTRHTTLTPFEAHFRDFHVYDLPRSVGVPASILLVHRSIAHTAMPTVQHRGQSLLRVCISDRRFFHEDFVVASVYAPPRRNHGPLHLPLLDQAFSAEHSLLLGDLNAPLISSNAARPHPDGLLLQSFLDRTGVVLLNDPHVPTYIHASNSSVSCIDYALATPQLSRRFSGCSVVADVGSDHLPLCVTIRTRLSAPLPPPPLGWHLSATTDYGPYKQTLTDSIRTSSLWPPTPCSTPDSIDQAVDLLTSLIQSAAQSSFPPKRSPQPDRPRLPHHVLLLISTRRQLKARQSRDPDPQTRRSINRVSKLIRREIDAVKRQIEERRLDAVVHGPRHPDFWNVIRRRFKGPHPLCPPLLSPDNRLITAPQEQALLFHDSLADLLSAQPSDSLPPPTSPAPYDASNVIVRPLTPASLHTILRRLRSGRSTGPDLIPYELLRHANETLWLVLSSLYNDMIRLAHIPQSLKVADVIFLPKVGKDLTQVANFRPITLSSTILKLLEFHVASCFSAHLESHGLLRDTHLAFRPQRQTVDQLLTITELSTRAFNVGHCSAVLSLDIKKAFDSVPHTLLADRLQALGDSHLAQLTTQLITRRSVRVRHANQHSPFFTPGRGLPQGSPLSPVLFNAFLSSVPVPSAPALHQFVYADDVTLIAIAPTPTAAWGLIASHVQPLADWLRSQGFQLQPEKSQLLFHSRSNQRQVYPVTLVDGHHVNHSPTLRLLGVVFDRRLHFTAHLRHLLTTIPPVVLTIRLLLQQHPAIPQWIGLLLHNVYVKSRLLYGAPLLLQAPPSSWRRLEQLYRSSLRAATRSHRRTHIPRLLARASTTSFRTLYDTYSRQRLLRYVELRRLDMLGHLEGHARRLNLRFTPSPLRRIFDRLPWPLQQFIIRLANLQYPPGPLPP